MKVYVASSWRNVTQPSVVLALRAAGHMVYDFRNPAEGDHGFHWRDIDSDWGEWTPQRFIDALDTPSAISGFSKDWSAMLWAEACVLVMPCGRSSHLEAGYFVGAGKPLIILLSNGEPELMYKMATALCTTVEEVKKALT